jgi:non-lysosomal glucosylceramidase
MVAMPLGGIGTGNVSLGGNGALKQWQICNQGNHLGAVPQSFFALRISSLEPPKSERRILQAGPIAPHPEPAPEVNDQLDAAGPHRRDFMWPHVAGTTFEGAYPFARVEYEDDWPIDVRLEAYTPFVPLDADASGLPLVSFTFTMTNRFSSDVLGWLLGTLQNVVGWDGAAPIRDARCSILGGNHNRAASLADGTAILMGNDSLEPTHRGTGSMALWTSATAYALPQFDDADTALALVDSLKLLTPVVLEDWSPAAVSRAVAALRPPVHLPTGPSAAGTTWAGGLAVPIHLKPGESTTVEIVYAWHFPNRYADFDRFGDSDDPAAEPTWIGNHYATTHAAAEDVVGYYASRRGELRDASSAWPDVLYNSTLPPALIETLATQPSLVRSPTTFRSADGKFFGFEGVLGESTRNWNGNIGGSCPLNCTHVWNYEQAVSRLFPELDRSMRETDWDVLQAPEGYLPHRVQFPLDGPQLHGRPVGGPTRPALDGMLGTVLKTYREVRQGAGAEWLERYLPHARRLMDYVSRTWDVSGTGVLTGDQPVTHDISLQGANMYVGAIWLAALRAMQEMCALGGAADDAVRYGRTFLQASASYDELLWNGEYYSQQSQGEAFDFGSGCLTDQLFGQSWAHQLDLGYLLPVDHVQTALRSIAQYNMRHGFRDFHHGYRVFADAEDSGMLICTWPHGGRPEIPIRYSDEVWTGVEYQVAAHCLFEGMVTEGLGILAAVRARYDGTRRNPYNEIECGDHYSRAMAGWGALDAYTGASYDAATGSLRLGRRASRYPLFAGPMWGEVVVDDQTLSLRCLGGSASLRSINVTDALVTAMELSGRPAGLVAPAGPMGVSLSEPTTVSQGSTLVLRLAVS